MWVKIRHSDGPTEDPDALNWDQVSVSSRANYMGYPLEIAPHEMIGGRNCAYSLHHSDAEFVYYH